MRTRVALLLLLVFVGVLAAQEPIPNLAPQINPVDAQNAGNVFFCPMDPDVRSHNAGKCARCGMALVEGLPDPVEYHLDLSVTPRTIKPGQTTSLTFAVHDPWKNRLVTNFQLMHEKLFHMFIVSHDLQVFVHNHPTLGSDGLFHYDYIFPKPGMYRILGDFYPDGATPQLIAKSVIVPGPAPKPAPLVRDYSPKDGENMKIELVTEPPQPIAGATTQMILRVNPGEGLEKYLGAWGHMLVASADLIDLVHEHPFIADGGPQVQFNVIFPRAKAYRVWVQLQRRGVVNTVHFDIPVKTLGEK
jgi:hypothetical protein